MYFQNKRKNKRWLTLAINIVDNKKNRREAISEKGWEITSPQRTSFVICSFQQLIQENHSEDWLNIGNIDSLPFLFLFTKKRLAQSEVSLIYHFASYNWPPKVAKHIDNLVNFSLSPYGLVYIFMLPCLRLPSASYLSTIKQVLNKPLMPLGRNQNAE